MKHKHAKLIKSWADGAEIETWFERLDCWISTAPSPMWLEDALYRIKPELKLDAFRHYYVTEIDITECLLRPDDANLELILDGQTGELKSAKVI